MRSSACGLRPVCEKSASRARAAPSLYSSRPRSRPAFPRSSHSHEANLSAERAPAEAPARIPGADVDAGRPRHPQAPPRQGPQAPLGLNRGGPARRQPPLALARLRRRLPPRPLGLDALPRSLLVPARRGPDRDGAAARPRRLAPARRRRRAQPDEAAPARGVRRAPRRAAGRARLRPDRAAGPHRGRREPTASRGSASACAEVFRLVGGGRA